LKPGDRYNIEEARCCADLGRQGDCGHKVRYEGDPPDDNAEQACQSSSIRPRPDPALHGDPLADHTAGPVPPLAAGAIGTAETRHDEAPAEEPEPAELRSSLATNLLAFFFIFYILCWNLTTATSFTLPERTVPLGTFLGLDQYWGMFASSPSNEDGWYVIPGELRDGLKVDLMPIIRDDYGMHPISYEKP
jgi:hypothetical protein